MSGHDRPRELPFEFGGIAFRLLVYKAPSGLRGQVFHGEEKVAGMRIYHSEDIDRLRAQLERDRAFLRAVERLSGTGKESQA